MNKVVLIGRATKDPELKFTPGTGTAVCTLTMAVDRRTSKEGQREADFIPVVIWGKQAENTATYVAKGKMLGVSGRIQTRSYDAKDGTKRYITEVVAEEVQFIEWAQQKGQQQSNAGYSEDITPIDDDGEIPF
jgi:single-strand DNA-binding protein